MAEKLSVWEKRFMKDLSSVRNYSPLTVTAYQRDLSRFLDSQRLRQSFPGDRVFAPQRFQDHLATLAVGGLSNRSIARAAAVLRSFMSFLHRNGAAESDWSERVPSVKFASSLPRFVSESQMRGWLDSVPARTRWEFRDRGLIELMYATGARVAEIVGLNWVDFDPREGMVRLFGKRRRERMAPVGTHAGQTLEQLRRSSPVDSTREDKPIFVNRREGRLTTRSVSNIVADSFARATGGHVSPHRLRHTCATHLLDRGADLLSLQQLLGHQNVATTQIYTHTTPHRLAEVYNKFFPGEKADVNS